MSTLAKEYRWVLIVSLLILAFSSVPLFAGYAAQTPDQRFIGSFTDRMDYAVHLAMMHYGEQGGWAYQLRFTTEPHDSAYVRTFYVILGHIGGWLGLPAVLLFQIARLGFGLLALFAIYRLLTRVFTSVRERQLAFILAVLGAGLGWLQIPLGWIPDPQISPIDFWLIDAYLLFSLALFAHFSAAIAALVLALTAFLDQIQQPRWQNIALISICAIFVQMVNPIAFILADLAMAGAFVFSCWKNRKMDWPLFLTLSFLAVIQIPLLAYSLILLTQDPTWAEFNRQNITLSPPPVYLLLGFGLFWPFTLFGAIQALRQQEARLGWAVVWMVAALGMAYLPMAIQRRFLLAIGLPLAVLAAPAILRCSTWLHRHSPLGQFTGAMVITVFITASPIALISASSLNMFSRPDSLFEKAALVQAVDWLHENSIPDQVVLASEPTAQLVAIRIPIKLYFGHAMETLRYAEKAQAVERFYRGQQPASWLASQEINWVILGPHEKAWRPFPLDLPNLKIAYQNDLVTIYQVIVP
jgi:hypothetical protein